MGDDGRPTVPDASGFGIMPVGLHTMGSTFLDKQSSSEFGRSLNVECRCFGDKGDVEDITEGQCVASLSRAALTFTFHISGHNINSRI